MTEFEKDYVLICLAHLDSILASPEEIQRSVLSFTQGNLHDIRYQENSKITDSPRWNPKDKSEFLAAFFEASARADNTTIKSPEDIGLAHDARALWQATYMPLLTQDTQSDDRLKSVRENIVKLRNRLANEGSLFNNPFVLFSVAATVIGVGAIVTKMALKS